MAICTYPTSDNRLNELNELDERDEMEAMNAAYIAEYNAESYPLTWSASATDAYWDRHVDQHYVEMTIDTYCPDIF
jgi:hypothetical protein